MWFYAFVFASRESINRIGDEQWMSRSEAVCAAARTELQTLARPISIDPTDTAALAIKAGIVERGLALGVDFGLTHTCYDPVLRADTVLACGRCDACQLRLAGFRELDRVDPIAYVECEGAR